MAIFNAKPTAPPSSKPLPPPLSPSKKSTGPPPPLSPSKSLPPPLSPSFFHGEEYGLPASFDTNILARSFDFISASLGRISSTTQARMICVFVMGLIELVHRCIHPVASHQLLYGVAHATVAPAEGHRWILIHQME